jgi:hypothetical protein
MILAKGSSIPSNNAVAYRRYVVTTLSTLPENRTRRESKSFINLALDKSGRLFVLEEKNGGLVREMVASLVPARKGSVAANQTLVVCKLFHLCLYGSAWLQQQEHLTHACTHTQTRTMDMYGYVHTVNT